MDQAKLREVYARLKGLRANIPMGGSNIEKRWVDELHKLIELLAQISSADLEGFRVGRNAITVDDPGVGDLYYDSAFVASKIDALLSYFELAAPRQQPKKPPPKIGFHPPT